MTLSFHPYANLFPLIEGQEFYDLAQDIRLNGLREQVELVVDGDGAAQILDGRNRYRALVWIVTTGEPLGDGWGIHAGRQLTVADLTCPDQPWRSWLYLDGDADDYGDDLLAYVLSKNLHRRQMTDDQRRMLAAELVTLRQGRPAEAKTSQIANISREQAAGITSTDLAGVDRARSVIARGAPEIVAAVKEGRMSVAAAAAVASQPAERQAEILQNLPRDESGKLTPDVKKALGPVIAEIRKEKTDAKKERRAEREQTLGRKLQALPAKTYGVAIEDFEWHHDAWSMETGANKHPSMHYETAQDAQTPEEIVARCAERFACLADDCILFKWTTLPHLAIALKVLELQGFRYVTHLVWNKERSGASRGTGYWFTGEHEIVLVGVRGKVVPPATAHFRSNFSAPVGEHSEKPDNLHEIVEFHWPTTPKVEFNARRGRPGWKTWGFDAPVAPQSDVDTAPPAQSEALPPARDEPVADPSAAVPKIKCVRGTFAQCDTAAKCTARGDCKIYPFASHPVAASPAVDDLDIPDFLRRVPRPQTEMDLTRRDRQPPEVVDDTLQTRLPLTDDEIEMQSALLAIDAGEHVDWPIARNLIGAGFAHATTTRVIVTDEGRAFLAQLVAVPAPAKVEARA